MKEEISLLNLINGLNLSTGQIEKILTLAKESIYERDKLYNNNIKIITETKDIFKKLKDQLIINGTEVEKEIEQIAVKNEKAIKETEKNLDITLKKIEEELKYVFTKGQLEIITEFKKCLVPPKNLRYPTRSGQAYDSGPTENLLCKIRELDKEAYKNQTNDIINKLIDYEEEKYLGKLDQEQREIEKERILTTINKAINMEEADFQLNKAELAKEIDLKYKKDQLEKSLYYLSKANYNLKLDKIGYYFLNEKIIPILEKKIVIAKSFQKPDNVNLSKITPINDGEKIKNKVTDKKSK